MIHINLAFCRFHLKNAIAFDFHKNQAINLVSSDIDIELITYLYYKLSKLYQQKNDFDNAKIYAEMSKGCVEGMKGRLVGRVIYNWGIL